MSFIRNPPEGEITPEALVAAWMAYEESRGGPRVDVWASDYLDHLVSNEPEVAWTIIIRLVAISPSDSILASIAAGPLEDLLVNHGPGFAERAVALSKQDARFRKCLRGAWLGRSTDGTRQKIKEAVGDEPIW
jgi:hypothetical protein